MALQDFGREITSSYRNPLDFSKLFPFRAKWVARRLRCRRVRPGFSCRPFSASPWRRSPSSFWCWRCDPPHFQRIIDPKQGHRVTMRKLSIGDRKPGYYTHWPPVPKCRAKNWHSKSIVLLIMHTKTNKQSCISRLHSQRNHLPWKRRSLTALIIEISSKRCQFFR